MAALSLAFTSVWAQTPPPTDSEVERRDDSILSQMTTEEKIDLLSGINFFDVRGIPRLKVPLAGTADGPFGVRNDGPATVMAGGISLAATWNRHYPDGGLLDRCTATHTCPKIIEVLGSSEFWTLRASPDFVGTSADHDIPLPDNVRRYYVAITQHGGGKGGFHWAIEEPPQSTTVGQARLSASHAFCR